MLGFDKTGTWVEGAAVRRGRGYRAEALETLKHERAKDPEIGYRPLIYTIPSKGFSWIRFFGWFWNRNPN